MALYHSDTGSVNYTVVGSPTIVDGVASGFSSSDNLYVDSPITSGTNSIEVGCKFTTGTISEQCVIGSRYNFSKYGFNIHSDGTLRTGVRVSVGGTEDNKVLFSTLVLSANTTYYAIMSCSKSTHILTLKISTDNENWTSYSSDIGAFDNFVSAGRITAGYTQNGAFLGSVDLNGTYIKVDGSAYFGVCPVEVKHIDYGTSVGYTVVGSPTISNGVVSGFSASNYLGTGDLSSDTAEVELFALCTPSSTDIASGTHPAFGFINYGTSNSFVGVANSGRPWCTLKGIGGTTYDFNKTTIILQADVPVYLKLAVKNNVGTFSYSLNNSTWTEIKSVDMSADPVKFLQGNNFRIGHSAISNNIFNGSIDLNQTYIKVNGKLWFFRPVTNYLIKDDKLVFADSDVYIDDNGTKTYASANIAPVPAGFTFGNTTTSDVGLVDMTTQTFTAVPGATWGKGASAVPVVDANTVALWHLDDTATSEIAGAINFPVTTYTTGKFGKCTAEITSPGLYYPTGTGDFTLDFWVSTAVAGKYDNAYGHITMFNFAHSTGAGGIKIYVSTAGNLALTVFSSQEPTYDNAGDVYNEQVAVSGDWAHISCERKQGTIYIYVNGVLKYSWYNQWITVLNSDYLFYANSNMPRAVDEVRYSTVAEHDGAASFTPNEEPYAV